MNENTKLTRKSWDDYFLEIAKTIAARATCLRLQVGCVITKDNKIISTGYNGAPPGHPHCIDIDVGCLLNEHGRCIRCTHAELSAILQADRALLKDAALYVTHEPCENCARTIAHVGITQVVYIKPYPNAYNQEFLKGIQVLQLVDGEIRKVGM